jgi:hypothetical protein
MFASAPVADSRQINPTDHHGTAVILLRRFAETSFSHARAKESRESGQNADFEKTQQKKGDLKFMMDLHS